MPDGDALTIDYMTIPLVRELIDRIVYCVESVSLEFDRWDNPHARGPGLYFLIVAGTSVEGYADPMGDNCWPVDRCATVFGDLDVFFQIAREVAIECDGAVVISADGAILKQMVRVHDLTGAEPTGIDGTDELVYADWMGARHMSALDASVRTDVIAAITLSEQDGRVTVFTDGEFIDYQRDELGGEWRTDA